MTNRVTTGTNADGHPQLATYYSSEAKHREIARAFDRWGCLGVKGAANPSRLFLASPAGWDRALGGTAAWPSPGSRSSRPSCKELMLGTYLLRAVGRPIARSRKADAESSSDQPTAAGAGLGGSGAWPPLTGDRNRTARQHPALLTHLLTRLLGTAETRREPRDPGQVDVQVTGMYGYTGDREDVRRATHNPASADLPAAQIADAADAVRPSRWATARNCVSGGTAAWLRTGPARKSWDAGRGPLAHGRRCPLVKLNRRMSSAGESCTGAGG